MRDDEMVRKTSPVTMVLLTVMVGLGLLVAFAFMTMSRTTAPVWSETTTAELAPVTAHVTGGSVAGKGSTVTGHGADSGVVTADDAWVQHTATLTGIPQRALAAYAAAELIVRAESPSCELGWNTVAAIGAIETNHGRFGGSSIGADGRAEPEILGIVLDGSASAAIPDTDGGALDGNTTWDRAVGPMQFIPETWKHWGADANGDGVADPHNIDDAALTTARYLCASSDLDSAASWRAAIFAYNHLDSYVDDVAAVATQYAEAAG